MRRSVLGHIVIGGNGEPYRGFGGAFSVRPNAGSAERLAAFYNAEHPASQFGPITAVPVEVRPAGEGRQTYVAWSCRPRRIAQLTGREKTASLDYWSVRQQVLTILRREEHHAKG